MKAFRIFLLGLTLLVASCVTTYEPNVENFSKPIVTLYGKSYSIDNLVSVANPPSNIREGNFWEAKKLWAASEKLVAVTMEESFRREVFDCDLSVAEGEIREFLSWWRAAYAPALNSFFSDMKLFDEEEITSYAKSKKIRRDERGISYDNVYIRSFAKRRILEHKRDLCLFKKYPGGRLLVFFPQTPYLTSRETHYNVLNIEPGWRYERLLDVKSVKLFDGYLLPTGARAIIPVDAYMAHFRYLTGKGVLTFLDSNTQNVFLDGLDAKESEDVPMEQAKKDFSDPYWRSG